MSLNQSVRKFVKHTILRRPRPTVEAVAAPVATIEKKKRRRSELTPAQWQYRRSRSRMARESRRRNRA